MSDAAEEVLQLQKRLLAAETAADELAIAADRAVSLEREVGELKQELSSAKARISELEERLASGGGPLPETAGKTAAEDEGDDAFLIAGPVPRYETSHILERCHGGTNVLCARIHPAHSDTLASGAVDRAVRFWQAKANGCYADLGAVLLPAPVLSMDFRPAAGGALLASCMDGSHHLVSWGASASADAASCDDARAFPAAEIADAEVAAAEVAAVGSGAKARVLAAFKDHGKYVVCCRWAPGGELFATASHDQKVSLYRLNSSNATATAVTTLHLPGAAEAIEFVAGDGALTLVVAHRGGSYLTYVNCETLQQSRVGINANAWDEHVSFAVLGLQRSPGDGGKYLLAACEKNRSILYRAGSNRHVRVLHAPQADAYFQPRCVWEASGKFAMGNAQPDNDLRVYCLASGREVERFAGHTGAVRDVASAEGCGRFVTASYDKSVRLWEPVSS